MKDSFWLDNPKILIDKNHITNIWPFRNQNFTTKLNALTRLIVLLTILAFMITKSSRVLLSGVISVMIIVILYRSKTKREGFSSNDISEQLEKNRAESLEKAKNSKLELSDIFETEGDKDNFIEKNRHLFTNPTFENPFMNRLLGESGVKKRALPITENVDKEIEKKVKENPYFLDDPKVYSDLGDNLQFEEFMRQFYTVANTKLPNDQKAFGEWLYGNMPSCKDGDAQQCLRKASGNRFISSE